MFEFKQNTNKLQTLYFQLSRDRLTNAQILITQITLKYHHNAD